MRAIGSYSIKQIQFLIHYLRAKVRRLSLVVQIGSYGKGDFPLHRSGPEKGTPNNTAVDGFEQTPRRRCDGHHEVFDRIFGDSERGGHGRLESTGIFVSRRSRRFHAKRYADNRGGQLQKATKIRA